MRSAALRRAEADQMLAWASLPTCRLRFLREALDDDTATDCGRCDRCTDHSWYHEPDPLVVAAAHDVLRGGDVVIEPRRQWPIGLDEPKGRIAADRQAVPGRALARLGDGGWNPVVERLIDAADGGGPVDVPSELVDCDRRRSSSDGTGRPVRRGSARCRRVDGRRLIDAVADSLGALGKLPVHRALVDRDPTRAFQADQANSAHQVGERVGSIRGRPRRAPGSDVLTGPVLLVDDEIDSRWTITVAALGTHRRRLRRRAAVRAPCPLTRSSVTIVSR